MTESPSDAIDGSTEAIARKRERVEAIVEQLEDGEVSLERASELFEEGQALLEELEEDLDLEEGSVTVRE